jgi:hypothetical protein
LPLLSRCGCGANPLAKLTTTRRDSRSFSITSSLTEFSLTRPIPPQSSYDLERGCSERLLAIRINNPSKINRKFDYLKKSLA